MIRTPTDRLRQFHPIGAIVCALTLVTIATGCSKDMDNLGYTPSRLGVEDARAKTKSVSSQIFDMIGIKQGRTTEPGPGISTCEEDPKQLFKSRHPWSLFGVPPDELKQGFERLKESLPKKGWKVVEYGPNDSANKNLELTADSGQEHFSVNAELRITGESGRKQPLILVNVVSGCYRAPEGTDLDGVY